MGHCDRQGNIEQDVGKPQGNLSRQRCGNQPDGAVQLPVIVSAPDQYQQNCKISQNHQGTGPMGYVNRYSSIRGELPPQIVRANVLGNVKTVLKIHVFWPPLALTGWQIWTGNCCIVRCSPGAQSNLHDDQKQTTKEPRAKTLQIGS